PPFPYTMLFRSRGRRSRRPGPRRQARGRRTSAWACNRLQQWGFHRTANATTAALVGAALVGAALGRDRAQGALPQWESRAMRWGRRTLRATEPETRHDPRTPHAAPPRSAPGVAAAPPPAARPRHRWR